MGEQPAYRGASITGVGFTDFSKASGRSVLALAAEACRAAIADAGLEPADVDGVVTYQYLHDSVPAQAVAAALGLGDLRHDDLDGGGPHHRRLPRPQRTEWATGGKRPGPG